MKYLSYSIVFLMLTACGIKRPYTEELKNKFDLNDKKLKEIQFYTSSTIILEQSYDKYSKGKADEGVVVSNSVKSKNRVIIPANTKCIVKTISQDEMEMLFNINEKKQEETLRFSIQRNQLSGRYYIKSSNDNDEVYYGAEKFKIANYSSLNSFLLVKSKELKKTRISIRKVKGIDVNNKTK